jgi:hypothetical protein
MMSGKPFLIFTLCLAFFPITGYSQMDEITPATNPQGRFLVSMGINWRLFNRSIRSSSIMLERPINPYQQLGIQFNPIHQAFPSSFEGFYQPVVQGGWEVGVLYKLFLHGRLSGRKSNIYFSPDVRFGRRKIEINYYDFSGNRASEKYNERSTTILLRWGNQYSFGPALLEIAIPFGVETVKANVDPLVLSYAQVETSSVRLVMLPSLHLGFRIK